MPRSIKWFVWLTVFYVVWCSFWNFHLVLWPTAHFNELLAKVPGPGRQVFESERQMIWQADLIASLIRAACFLLPLIVFAALAAIFRQGWARWCVVLVLVITETMWPLLYAGYTYFFQPDAFRLVMRDEVQNWLKNGYRLDVAHWVHWVSLSVMVLLVGLLFSPHSRRWFQKSA